MEVDKFLSFPFSAPTDVVLTKEEVAQLEERAASQPELRTVDPSKAWGCDIYSDKPEARL